MLLLWMPYRCLFEIVSSHVGLDIGLGQKEYQCRKHFVGLTLTLRDES